MENRLCEESPTMATQVEPRIDECHVKPANAYPEVPRFIPEGKVIGVKVTPSVVVAYVLSLLAASITIELFVRAKTLVGALAVPLVVLTVHREPARANS